MNIIAIFKRGERSHLFDIENATKNGKKLSKEQVKAALEFCSNAHKWDCSSHAEPVFSALLKYGYVDEVGKILIDQIEGKVVVKLRNCSNCPKKDYCIPDECEDLGTQSEGSDE